MQTGLSPPIEDNVRPIIDLMVFLFQYWPVLVTISICVIVWIMIVIVDRPFYFGRIWR
jgi:hypothetical protein